MNFLCGHLQLKQMDCGSVVVVDADDKAKEEAFAMPRMDYAKEIEVFTAKTALIAPEHERAAVEKHLALSAEISTLMDLRNRLIDEIHGKRCKPPSKRGNKSSLLSRFVYLDEFYKKVLYMGRKTITGLDPFPSAFSCYMDDALSTEAPVFYRSDYGPRVYYGQWKPKGNAIDVAEWALSSDARGGGGACHVPEGTKEQDIGLIMRFRDVLVDFMERGIAVTAASGYKGDGVIRMRREMDRFVKLTENLVD